MVFCPAFGTNLFRLLTKELSFKELRNINSKANAEFVVLSEGRETQI